MDFNNNPEAHRYWSEVLRRVPKFRQAADDSVAIQEWLEREGFRVDEFERRGGSHRFAWRPWRDWLHLHRSGSDAEEARRWNEDLARFRRLLELAPIEAIGRGTFRLNLKLASAALEREFPHDVALQRAYLEFVGAGARDLDATARQVFERRRAALKATEIKARKRRRRPRPLNPDTTAAAKDQARGEAAKRKP